MSPSAPKNKDAHEQLAQFSILADHGSKIFDRHLDKFSALSYPTANHGTLSRDHGELAGEAARADV